MVSLTDKYSPKTLDAFAGLGTAKRLLSKLRDNPWESAWMLVGDSGTGKTTMALATAHEMGAEVHHIASRQCDLEVVERTTQSCFYTPFLGEWHAVIVDEADQMTRAAQLCFLSKLDGTARPPKTIFFFTANETKLLEKRFLSRCRLIRFEGCQHAIEGAAFLARVWAAEAPDREPPDFAALLERNEFNLRGCLNDLEMELLAPGSLPQPTPPAAGVVPIRGVVDNEENPRRASALKAWRTIRARRAGGGHAANA
jgi:DNA polymerase III delta prime subunit